MKDVRGNSGNLTQGTRSQTGSGDPEDSSWPNHHDTAGNAAERLDPAKPPDKGGVTQTNRGDGGSRFALLANLANEEGDKEGGINKDMNEGNSANQGAKISETERKGKKPVVRGSSLMDRVELSASDPSLLQEVRSSTKTEMEKKNVTNPSIMGRTKSLEVQPAKLKSNWYGSKSIKGVLNKEVGPVMGWTAHGVNFNLNANIIGGLNGPSISVGPAHARPPDASNGGQVAKSLDKVHLIQTRGKGNEDGARCAEEPTAEMDHDRANAGAAVESVQAGVASTQR